MTAITSWGQQNFTFSSSTIEGQPLYYRLIQNSDNNTLCLMIVCPYYSSYGDSAYFGYTKPTGAITIPDSVSYNGNKYAVVNISNSAFRTCNGLTAVTIPSTITTIGRCAFYDCSALTSINIPNSVTSIAEWAFRGTTSLSTITLPNTINAIQTATFVCSGISSITIPPTVTCIHDRAFGWCNNLTSITIPNSVDSIGIAAFTCDSNLTSVTMGNSVSAIGYEAFYSCISLTNITIPNSVTSINDRTFCYCTGLTSVTIPSSVTSIGEAAFYGCTSLIKTNYTGTAAGWHAINIAEDGNPIYYSQNLYLNNTLLTNINFPEGTTTINSNFSRDTALISINIPNSVISINDRAFYGCSGIRTVTIGNSVTTIGAYAFSGCIGITSITIPNAVTSIGHYAFNNCTSLTKTNYNGTVSGWNAINIAYRGNPIVYSKNLYLNDILLTDLVFPDSTTIIKGNFAYDTAITTVTIPNSVDTIVGGAFYSCYGLTKTNYIGTAAGWISINTGEWYVIGSSPIEYSKNLYLNDVLLTNLILPEGITYVNNNFVYDTALTSVTIPSSVDSIDVSAFLLCENITTVHSHSSSVPILVNNDLYYGLFGINRNDIFVYIPCGTYNSYNTSWGNYSLTLIEENIFYFTVLSANEERGSAQIITYPTCSNPSATISATPYTGYRFVRWNDGNTDNPRYITATDSSYYTAHFDIDNDINSTTCIINSFPYINDFEYDATCWRYRDNNGDGVHWTWYSNYGFNNSKCLGIRSAHNADDWIWSPSIATPGTYTVNWKARSGNSNYPNNYEVYKLAPQTSDLIFSEVLSDTNYVDRHITFNVATGDTVAILFRYLNDYMSYFLIDNFSIQQGGWHNIDDIDNDGSRVYAVGNRIVVEGAEGETVNVYDMMGRQVDRYTNRDAYHETSIPTGVYIVKVGNRPAKKLIIVR